MYHNDKKYALTNCVLLDGSEHMEPQTGKAVCIDGEKINEIVDAQHIPAGYEAVDLGGKYVLPGLINMHVHLPASGKPKKKASDPKKLVKLITSCALTNRIGVNMCEGYAKTELLSGVTTIRTVGGVADYDTKIRDLAAAGKFLPHACWRRTWRSPSPAGTWRVRSPTRRTPPKRPRRSSKRSPLKSPTSSS